MWLGLLREPRAPGSPLGPTHKAILTEQFGRTIFGPEGNWWKTDARLQNKVKFFTEEIEGVTLEQVISENTGAAVSGNAFSSGGSVSFGAFQPNTVAADAAAAAGFSADADAPNAADLGSEPPVEDAGDGGAEVGVEAAADNAAAVGVAVGDAEEPAVVPDVPAVAPTPTPEPKPEPKPEVPSSGTSPGHAPVGAPSHRTCRVRYLQSALRGYLPIAPEHVCAIARAENGCIVCTHDAQLQ